MKNWIDIKDNLKFAKISGDYNKIHIKEKYAKNFFFKYCVVHGVNIVALSLSKFLKINCNNFFFIKELDIKFINYIEIGEKFTIEVTNNKIIVKNDINNKLVIRIKCKKFKVINKLNKHNILTEKKYYFDNLLNKDLINELLHLTKNIGTYIFGNGSLILKIHIQTQSKCKNKSLVNKINKNAFQYYLSSKNYKINCVVIKIEPYKNENLKITSSKKFEKHLKGKSILIFGSNGILGSFTKKYLSKYKTNLHLVTKTKNRKNSTFVKHYELNTINFSNLKKILKKAYPDYIFYFISPKILRNNNKNINKKLYNLYKFYYVTIFDKILKIIKNFKKKIFIFYPSTGALNEKNKSFKYSKEYKTTKNLGEKLCKTKKSKKIIPISYRIDQIKSPQNYNIAGFYEGSSTRTLKKYIDDFLLKSQI